MNRAELNAMRADREREVETLRLLMGEALPVLSNDGLTRLCRLINEKVSAIQEIDRRLETLGPARQEWDCPACSGEGQELPGKPGVFTCTKCAGIFGGVTFREEIFEFVKLDQWEKGEPDPKSLRYFDFTYHGRNGVRDGSYRTHGWYNPFTKAVTQFG